METDDNLDLYRLNAAAEIEASRITNSTQYPLSDGKEVLDNFLPSKPLLFEKRVELYFYLRLLERYKKEVKSIKPSEWQDKKLAQITEKKKEIEQCLLKVVIMQKPATPILDAFNKEVVSHEDEKRQLEIVRIYGSSYLTLDKFINSVLLRVKGKTLPKLCKLVEHGLIIYDNDNPISFPQLLASLEHRKTLCLLDADNLEFWDTLKNERNYQVKIDNVASAYYLMGNVSFDWYNWTIDKDVSIVIPNKIKADIKQDLSKFITYKEALHLKSELQITPDEIAMWIANGELKAFVNEYHGMSPFKFHFGEANYLKPLDSLHFLRDEIKNFEPINRYISRAALIERWANYWGEKAIDPTGDIKGQRLIEHHPLLGVVSLDEPSGVFDLNSICEIELKWSKNKSAQPIMEDDTVDKRQSQLHVFIWRVHQSLSKPKRPTAQKLWNEIQHRYKDHDIDEIIQEVTASNISWCSAGGAEQNQGRKTFDKTLSIIRKTPPDL